MSHPEPSRKTLVRRVNECMAGLIKMDQTVAAAQYYKIVAEEKDEEEDQPSCYGGNARRRFAMMRRRRDVSTETIQNAKAPLKIHWYSDSYLDLPVGR